jgi:hypothetical protein
VDIFKHTAKKNKKIKRADQILPEVYGTTLRRLVTAKPFPFWKKKIIFPFHCFFHILEENYRKERKNKIYISSHYIFLFGNFRLEM